MRIEKRDNEFGTMDIDIIDFNKVLRVYKRKEDIIISCFKDNYERISNISFDISENDYELYDIFSKLYDDVISKSDDSNFFIFDKENNNINIMSDTYPSVCPNSVSIKKEDGNINLSFNKVNGTKYGEFKMPHNIPIHIRKYGSRLGDLSVLFNNLFNDLQGVSFVKEYVRKR